MKIYLVCLTGAIYVREFIYYPCRTKTSNHYTEDDSVNDKPTFVVFFYKTKFIEKGWFKNDKEHRVNGPSTIMPDEKPKYFLNGKEYTKEIWKKKRLLRFI